MDTLQALTKMLDDSGTTPYQAAKAIGRGSSYVSGMVWRGSCPSADLLAQISTACGYRLELVPMDRDGETIHISGVADSDGGG